MQRLGPSLAKEGSSLCQSCTDFLEGECMPVTQDPLTITLGFLAFPGCAESLMVGFHEFSLFTLLLWWSTSSSRFLGEVDGKFCLFVLRFAFSKRVFFVFSTLIHGLAKYRLADWEAFLLRCWQSWSIASRAPVPTERSEAIMILGSLEVKLSFALQKISGFSL